MNAEFAPFVRKLQFRNQLAMSWRRGEGVIVDYYSRNILLRFTSQS